MNYLLLIIFTAYLIAKGHVQGAAFIWCAFVAVFHATEETKNKLWAYFADTTGARWLKGLEDGAGFWLFVAPALGIQLLAAWLAFRGDTINAAWLALLIGARIGDAAFSHLMPVASGDVLQKKEYWRTPKNPGMPSAIIYLIDGLIMLAVWRAQLAEFGSVVTWFAIGAGFFASVQPTLRLLKTRN